MVTLEQKEDDKYNQRTTIGQIADQKKKFAAEMTYYADAPKDLVSVSELITQQQTILAKNGENGRLRTQRDSLVTIKDKLDAEIDRLIAERADIEAKLVIAEKSALDLIDESTEQLEQNIAQVEQINLKVRANLDKDKASEDAKAYEDQYLGLTAEIKSIREEKTKLYYQHLLFFLFLIQ